MYRNDKLWCLAQKKSLNLVLKKGIFNKIPFLHIQGESAVAQW